MKKHFLMSLHHICQTCYEMRAYSEGASPTRGLPRAYLGHLGGQIGATTAVFYW